jgi:hypothetical protein
MTELKYSSTILVLGTIEVSGQLYTLATLSPLLPPGNHFWYSLDRRLGCASQLVLTLGK